MQVFPLHYTLYTSLCEVGREAIFMTKMLLRVFALCGLPLVLGVGVTRQRENTISYVVDHAGDVHHEKVDQAWLPTVRQSTNKDHVFEFVHMLQEAAISGSAQSLPSKAILDTMKSTFQTIIDEVKAEHDADQSKIDATGEAFNECTDAKDRAVNVKAEVDLARSTHTQCRADEVIQGERTSTACAAMKQALSSAQMAAKTPGVDGNIALCLTDALKTEDAAEMVACLQQAKLWSEEHLPVLNASKSKCDAEKKSLSTKQSECTSSQEVFETGYCQLATQQESTCSEIVVCNALVVSQNATKAVAESRKTLLTAAKVGTCLVDIIITAIESNVTISSHADKCINLVVDTSGLDLVYPAFEPFEAVCSTLDTFKKPGDADWVQQEYAGLQTKDVVPCVTTAKTALGPIGLKAITTCYGRTKIFIGQYFSFNENEFPFWKKPVDKYVPIQAVQWRDGVRVWNGEISIGHPDCRTDSQHDGCSSPCGTEAIRRFSGAAEGQWQVGDIVQIVGVHPDPTTATTQAYGFVATGVAGPERWFCTQESCKNGGFHEGVQACYETVMADPKCAKDYFSYVPRGDGNCGCKTAGYLSILAASVSDYYFIKQAPGEAS